MAGLPAMFYAQVLSANAPTVTITYRGSAYPGVRIPPWYAPQAGDNVTCAAIGDAASQVVEVISCTTPGRLVSTSQIPKIQPANTFDGNPAMRQVSMVYVTDDGLSVELVRASSYTPPVTSGRFVAGSTGTWRAGQWRGDTNQPIQGDSGGGYGPNEGEWVYGSWAAAAGKTVSSASITLARAAALHGSYGAVACVIALTSDAVRPGGAPTLVTGFQTVGAPGQGLTCGQTADFVIPTAWGQMFASGTATGIACSPSGPYLRFADLIEAPTCGRVNLNY